MKKEYLDFLYKLKSLVEDDIKQIGSNIQAPKRDESFNDVFLAELLTRKSQLSSINDCIIEYLKLHQIKCSTKNFIQHQ